MLKTTVAGEDQAEFLGYNLKMLQYLCKGTAQCREQAHDKMELPLPVTCPKIQEIVLCSSTPIVVILRLTCVVPVQLYDMCPSTSLSKRVE